MNAGFGLDRDSIQENLLWYSFPGLNVDPRTLLDPTDRCLKAGGEAYFLQIDCGFWCLLVFVIAGGLKKSGGWSLCSLL